MIKSVKFKNFKSLENFTVSLDQRNILVGPNNAGKSTILDAFRALYGAVRYARTKRPQRIRAANGSYLQGYEIPEGSIVISPENIQTNYDDIETEIRFKLDNGNSLILEFSQHHVPHLLLEQNSGQTNTTRDFQRNFPVDIVVIPTLGPFEDEEELLTQEYIMANVSTRRSHRLFRNIWHYKNEREFKSFSDLLVQTWPEIEIKKPERRGYLDRHIDMFCSENRIDREVHWAGFGFQIWLQILTHILEAEETRVRTH